MNIMSLISIVTGTVIVLSVLYSISMDFEKKIRIWLYATEGSFFIWCVGYAMFFAALTEENAMFWHKVSSIGWSLFAPFVAMYFIEYTESGKKYEGVFKRILFFIIPVIILIRNIFISGTCVTIGLKKSQYGWSYISNYQHIDYWVYLLQIIIFFIIGFIEIYHFRKKTPFAIKKEMALAFIILDLIALSLGFVSEFLLPAMSIIVVPLSHFGIFLFQIGYIFIINYFELYNIDNVVTSRNIIETCGNPILLLDSSGEILKCNNATSDFLNIRKKDLLGVKLKEFFYEKKFKKINIQNLFNKNILRNTQGTMITGDGYMKNVMISATLVSSKFTDYQGIIVSIYDITEMIKIKKDIEESNYKYLQLVEKFFNQSYFDQLTKLPNRRKFYEYLKEIMDFQFCIVFMDLDGFKKVNDTYGHEIGDKMLIEASEKIKKISNRQFTARLGGDEFVTVIIGRESEINLNDFLEDIYKEFESPVLIDGNVCHVGISCGYSFYKKGMNIDNVIGLADKKMYKNKKLKNKKGNME